VYVHGRFVWALANAPCTDEKIRWLGILFRVDLGHIWECYDQWASSSLPVSGWWILLVGPRFFVFSRWLASGQSKDDFIVHGFLLCR
jgi:hypothetical protein